MRTKITLSLIAFVVLSSCIKDYHGHGPKEVTLTAKNYIYEGDLYGFYLNTEIQNLDEKIKELEAVSPNDEGYDQAIKDLAEAKKQKDTFNQELKNIVDLGQFGIIDPDIPTPPCFCWGLTTGLEFLLTVPDTDIRSVTILDLEGKVISRMSTEFSPLPEFKGEVLYQEFKIVREVKGEVLIQVEKVGPDGKPLDYIARGFVQ